MTARRLGQERGSAGLLALTGLLLVLTGAGVLGCVGAAAVSHTSAEAAADATALSVAQRLISDEDPCATGATIAQANRAELTSCRLDGNHVEVRVSAPLPHLVAMLLPGRTATATAAAELRVDEAELPRASGVAAGG